MLPRRAEGFGFGAEGLTRAKRGLRIGGAQGGVAPPGGAPQAISLEFGPWGGF